MFRDALSILDAVDKVIERKLEADIDHIVWVGCGDDIVSRRVVPEQVHWELDMVDSVKAVTVV